MDTTKAITHLSLCAGYDGIGIGLERVLPNLRAIAFVEVEAFAIANLVSKMESEQLDAAPIYSDVKTFPYKEFCGRVDILSGGFPCQPFSNAGVKKGVEDPRHLYPYISRGIEECKPRIVFLENVEGIISSKTAEGESVLQYVLKDLERLGYQATAGVFSASEIGFPHQRKRVFIMGYSNNRQSRPTDESKSTKEKLSQSSTTSRSERQELGNTERVRQSQTETTNEWEEYKSHDGRGIRSVSRTTDNTNISDTNGRGGKEDKWRRESGLTHEESKTRSASELGNTERTRQSSSDDRQRETQYGRTSPWDVQSVARPNEQQHEWEQPRVKPKLGRTTNGSSSRVDRLRLLGNGVVPQVAAKAFVTLYNRFLVRCEDIT